MSEDLTYCVRGCRRTCGICAPGDDCEHDLRRRADIGYLCRRCADHLTRLVKEIPDLYAQLPAADDPTQGDSGEKVKRGKVTGSPALVRLDVLVLTDLSVFTFEGDGVMPILPALAGWGQIIEEELGLRPQSDTIVGYCDLFTTWHTKIYAQPWIDEYDIDIRKMHRALRHVSLAPRPLGRCWGRIRNRPHGGCGALLYPPEDPNETTIRCPNIHCGRTYTGVELVKLGIQAEREGVA